MQYSFILAVLAAVSSAVPTPQTGNNNVNTNGGTAVISVSQVPSLIPTPATSGGCGGATESDVAAPAKVTITSQQVLAAAPGTSACTADDPMGCSTTQTAATELSAAFAKYGHTTWGQQAALFSLMTFESADFKFSVNLFPPPGRPGQGTKALMMFPFVYGYALSQSELKAQVISLGGGQELSNPDSADPTTKNNIRALVLTSEYTFGSASWYLNNKCDPSFATQLSTGTLAAFSNYISNCVQTEFNSDRQTNWCKVVGVLKPAGEPTPQGC